MDERPGHLTKVRGVLKALSSHISLSVQEIPVRWKPRVLRSIVPYLPGVTPAVCLTKPVNGRVDLVISAGGATEWVNARLARAHGAANIFLGSLRTCSPDAFTVLPRIETGDAPQILVMDLVPSEIDASAVAAAAETELSNLGGRYWTVLIGGDGSGCVWTPSDYAVQADLIIAEAAAAGVRLIVTSSRRTGEAGERVWRDKLAAGDRLELGVWYSRREVETSPRLAAMLGRAERIIITEDSASMVNEAVATGRPVATIAPTATKPNTLLEGMLQRLEARRLVVRLRGANWRLAALPDDYWRPVAPDWHTQFGRELLNRIESVLKK